MQISFLLGAGFSVPDRYPDRKSINARLRRIEHDQFFISSDGTAFFLDEGQPFDEEGQRLKYQERMFVKELIDYYTLRIIDKETSFDYESFYDFYFGFKKGYYKCYRFSEFTDGFRKKYNYDFDDLNLLKQFDNTFNQLIASLLIREPSNRFLTRPYSKYAEFLSYIDQIKDAYKNISFHTLNHDQLFEELANSDVMENDFADGFDEYDSPYSSIDANGNVIVIRRYTDKYDKKFCLYKLHGSIDQYIYNFQNVDCITIKVPYGASIIDLKKEYRNIKGELVYDKCWWNYYPDFLSGHREKIKAYNNNRYYSQAFSHFADNLRNSDYLILIGYGLGDTKINEFIKSNFLVNPNKIMIVISKERPESDLFDYKNVKYYGENLGVQHINKNKIDDLLRH